MYRTLYIFIFVAFVSLSLTAQESKTPKRTAIDIAQKQTEMLTRELDITDSILRDTLFKVHLKYAKLRYYSNTRSEALQCMQQLLEELKNILPAELYEQFMNRQIDGSPRSPHNPCNWLAPKRHHNVSPASPQHEEDNTPPSTPEHQPQDHQ